LTQLIKVWVINLKSRPDRLQRISEQLNSMNIEWSCVEAVDGKNCEKTILDISTNLGELGGLSEGVRGCSASHYKFWKKFISSGEEFGIVLEDDVKLSNEFKCLICDLSWIPKNANIIKLEKFTANRPSKLLLGHPITMALNDTREIRLMYSRHGGTGAYLISKNGAKKAIDWPKPFTVPIDHVLFNETVSKLCSSLKPLILVPPIAWQSDDIGHGSDITQFVEVPISRLKKKIRSIKRGYFEARLWPYQLFVLLTGKAKIISVSKK
jgi:glycosyl transferase, family 25